MKKKMGELSRREREMMDIVISLGRATAGEVAERLASAPTYSAVRATLRILEQKGFLKHEAIGNRYVFFPAIDVGHARRSALRNLVDTFFDGSVANVVASLLDQRGRRNEEELQRIEELIAAARRKK